MLSIFKTEDYNQINSLENGDCAFNAYSLGFSDLVMANSLDDYAKNNRYNEIITKLNKTIPDIKDWETFKKFLISKKNDPRFIQQTLAPIFRSIALDLKEKEQQSNGINDGEKEILQAEFRDYVFGQLQLPIKEDFLGGDIYQRIPAFLEKFNDGFKEIETKLKNNKDIDLSDLSAAVDNTNKNLPLNNKQYLCLDNFQKAIKDQQPGLTNWFENKGYKEFIEYQRNATKWAGDIELAPLSEYLGICVKTERSNTLISIYDFHGSIPRKLLNKNQIRLLQDRGVIDRNDKSDELLFLELKETDLIAKLNSIENSEIITEFCISHEESMAKEQIAVPENWIPRIFASFENPLIKPETFFQLLERGIISRDGNTDRFLFTKMTLAVLLNKIEAVDDDAGIIKLWKQNYKDLPLVILSNPHSVHWYYLQPKTFKHWDLTSLQRTTNSSINSELLDYFMRNPLSKLNEDKEEETNAEITKQILYNATMRNIVFDMFNELENKGTASSQDDANSERLGSSPPSPNYFLADSELYDHQNFGSIVMGDTRNLPVLNPEQDDDALTDDETSSPNENHLEILNSPSPFKHTVEKPSFFNHQFSSIIMNQSESSPILSSYETESEDSADKFSSYSTYRLFSPSVSPPHKKSKHDTEPRLKDMATKAHDSLSSYIQHGNSEISSHSKDLILAFKSILKDDEIPPNYSIQLLLPKEYLSSFGSNIEFLPPKEVVEFTQKNMNQILYQANKFLTKEIQTLYLQVLLEVGDNYNYEAIKLFNNLFSNLLKDQALNNDLRDSVTKFNFSEIEKLENTSISKATIQKIKTYFIYCKLVAEKMDTELCATSILNYPEIEKHTEIKQLFETVKKAPNLESLNSLSASSLLQINTDNINDKNLSWAILCFIKVFKRDIAIVEQNVSNNSTGYSFQLRQ